MTAAPARCKAEAIDAWRLEFDAALAGRECHWPGLPAVADTIARHRIPVHLLHEVIEGVSMDIEPRRYATFADLAEYCYRVASVVGICCLHVWGYRSDGGRAEKLAEKCGIALQLTNIIRDVRDDACNGRIYLPNGGPRAVQGRARGALGRRPAQRQFAGTAGIPSAARVQMLRRRA